MPSAFTPTLSQDNKRELIDNYLSGAEPAVENSLQGVTTVDTLCTHFGAFSLSSAQLIEIIRLPQTQGDSLIAVINTWYGPAADSNVTFYSLAWQQLPPNDRLPTLTADDFLAWDTLAAGYSSARDTLSEGDALVSDTAIEGDASARDTLSEGDVLVSDTLSEGDVLVRDTAIEGDSLVCDTLSAARREELAAWFDPLLIALTYDLNTGLVEATLSLPFTPTDNRDTLARCLTPRHLRWNGSQFVLLPL